MLLMRLIIQQMYSKNHLRIKNGRMNRSQTFGILQKPRKNSQMFLTSLSKRKRKNN